MKFFKTFSILFLALALQNCQQKSKTYKANKPINIIMGLKTGEKLRVKVVFNSKDHTKGLSGTPSFEFAPDRGMLFFYDEDSTRRFWMPDTYFDLDIFFLDKDLKVLAVDRNVAHHPGRQTPPEIVQTRIIICRHVLELRADSPLAKKLKVNEKVNWESEPFPEQIVLDIHP